MPTISTKWESAGDKEYRDALKEIERGLSQTRAEAKNWRRNTRTMRTV